MTKVPDHGESVRARSTISDLEPQCKECGQYGDGHAQWCSEFDIPALLPDFKKDTIADFDPPTSITAGVGGPYYHTPADNAPPSHFKLPLNDEECDKLFDDAAFSSPPWDGQTVGESRYAGRTYDSFIDDGSWAAKNVRTFASGATRSSDEGKLDYEGFLSPLVLRRFAEYMHKHQLQSDGNLRASDNWQKGIPFDAYMKSFLRHAFDAWLLHRASPRDKRLTDLHNMEELLCAILFNVQGMLYEELRAPSAGENAV